MIFWLLWLKYVTELKLQNEFKLNFEQSLIILNLIK